MKSPILVRILLLPLGSARAFAASDPVELTELLVLSPHIEGSLSSLTDERRNATGVVDALGSEQMAKSGDGNAAAALKRVSGLSVMGGKYIYVRGLGERYSSTLFNGAPLPSPEPSRRVVPLDIFPTGILGSVVVRKTYSPNLGCEFGGGVVELATRTVPEKPVFNLAANLGYSVGTTFSKGKTYKGGKYDWLGFDDGSRKLPAAILNAKRVTQQTPSNQDGFSESQLEQLGEALPNVYSADDVTMRPDFGVSFMGGRQWNVFGAKLGTMSSVMLSNTWESEKFFEIDLADPEQSGNLVPVKRYDTNLFQNKARVGGIAVFNLDLGVEEGIEFISSYLHNSKKGVAASQGFDTAEGDDTERLKTRLTWTESSLWAEQIRGQHRLGSGDDFPLNWNYTYAKATSGDFARRSYTQEWQNGEWVLRGLPKRIDSTLVDESHSFQIDSTLPVYVDDTSKFDIGFGASLLTRQREADLRRLKWVGGTGTAWTGSLEKIFDKANIGPENSRFHIEEDTVNTDRYSASQRVVGTYGLFLFERKPWTFVPGVRWEDSTQSVETKDFHSADAEKVKTSLDKPALSPSFTITWEGFEKTPIRFGYSRTIARPDFKELSPSPFWDDRNDSMTRGNPLLKITEIHNFDLRLEDYFSATESASVGAFYKHFKDPVEIYQTGALDRAISYRNAKSAFNVGFEIDGRKELSSFVSWLNGFSVGGNYTYIHSRVDLGDKNDASTGFQSSSKRPLQGQSPYVFNLALEYEKISTGFSASILYNVNGERIVELGAQGEPDVYEQPSHLVDVVVSQKVAQNVTLKLQLKNLLGVDVEAHQGGMVISREEGDFSASLGVSGSF